MTTPTIPADTNYWVDVTCPQCGETETIPAGIAARIQKTKDEGKLGVKFTHKPVDHRCGQTTMTLVAESGEIVQLG
jgi:hypothetical protein